jgi:hypothetical protein
VDSIFSIRFQLYASEADLEQAFFKKTWQKNPQRSQAVIDPMNWVATASS